MASQKRCFSKSLVELLAQHEDGVGFRHVVRKKEAGVVFPAEVPEQALFGNALGDPPHESGLQASRPATMHATGGAAAPLPLRLGEHLREPVFQFREKASPRFQALLGSLVGFFGVELVLIATRRHQENVHVADLR